MAPRPILDALAESDQPWSLFAVTAKRHVLLAAGSGPEVVDRVPRHFLALSRPAVGGVIIRRDPLVVVMCTQRGPRLVASGRRWNFGDDLGDLTLLWGLMDCAAPDGDELAMRYLLWAALRHRHVIPADAIVDTALRWDLNTLAELGRVPPVERPTARAIWHSAHQAGRAAVPPPEQATERELATAVARAVPPRWAAAQVIRDGGFDEWADALMGVTPP